MKNINSILPPLSKNIRWAALTNLSPTLANINQLNKMLKHDSKWHTVIQGDHAVHVDGIPIVKKTKESMT